MLPALFAIVFSFSAIVAVRRNPSYTARSILRSLPVILLAIAAIVALIVAAVRLTANRSVPVIIATMVSIILFGCFFLIYVIYTASTPRDARLVSSVPPGTKLVHIHRSKVYRWLKAVAVLLLVCGALKLLLPGDAGLAALMFGAFLLFISSILLPIYYATSRMMDVSLTALEADPWVHWVYSPEQWQQWSEVQVARLQAVPPTFVPRRDWRKPAWALAALAAGVYLISPGGFLWKTAYIVFIVAVMASLVILSARGARDAPAKLRARLSAAPREVFFGRDGVFSAGVLTTWRTADIFLTSATIDESQPRSLMLRFERDVPNPYGPLQVIPINQAVLIPAGAEHDLALLQQRIAERCPTAQVSLA